MCVAERACWNSACDVLLNTVIPYLHTVITASDVFHSHTKNLRSGRSIPHDLLVIRDHWCQKTREPIATANSVKVGLGILQITSVKRCLQVWPWFGRSLFSTIFVEFDQAV